MVYVLAKDGNPLMPCSNVIARLLLKQHRAKVKRREPFTIKLTYDSTHLIVNSNSQTIQDLGVQVECSAFYPSITKEYSKSE